MARNKGTFKFVASLEVQAAQLLDPREKVDTKAELINKETWPYNGDTLYLTEGLRVSVVDEQAVYMLVDVAKALDADYSGWKRIDASAASSVEVVDSLTSDSYTAALSAAQGKALNAEIASINNKIAAVFSFKGSKDTLAEIEAIESPKTGDVWHNKENSGEYVYDGTSWEFLGINVDLTPYAKTTDVTTAISDAKSELSENITSATEDLQGKIDQKVDKADGKSLVADTLIEQISQNKSDIEALTTTVDTKAAQSDLEAVTTDVNALKTNVSELKVKDVDTTASSGVALNLDTEGKVSVNVSVETLTAAIKPNLGLTSGDIKLKANIGGTDDNPTYAANAALQDVLVSIDSRISANASSIEAAAANYATAAQGAKADSALQSVSASSDKYVSASFAAKANNAQALTVTAVTHTVSDASETADGLATASDVKSYVDNHVSSTIAWETFE